MSIRPHSLRVFLAAAALAAAAGFARADGALNMAWDTCAGDAPPVTNVAFACGTNTGSHTLVCSFVAPPGITQFVGAELYVDLISQSSPLPAWWALGVPRGCRSGSLSINTSGAGVGPGCLNTWAGGSGIAAIAGFGNPILALPTINPGNALQYATIDAAVAVTGPDGVALNAGSEYFLANLVIDHVHTTGAGACAGCADPVCLSFTRLLLSQNGQPDVYLSTPGANSLVTWQGSGANCVAVPVRQTTWGAIKSLYR